MTEDISKDAKKKITLSVRIYAFFEDIVSFVIWFLLINRVSIQSKVIYSFIDQIFLNNFYLSLRPYRILIFWGLFIISVLIFGVKRIFKRITLFLWHILLFPLIIILEIIFIHTPKIFKLINKIFGFINLGIKKIIDIAQKTWIYLTCFLVAFLCFYFIWTSQNIIIIIISMIILWGILILHLLYLFVWTSNPYLVFDALYNIVESIWKQLKKHVLYEEFLDKKEHKDYEKEKQEAINFLKDSIKVINKIKQKTIVLTDNRALVSWFMVIFLTSIVFTILIFSFEYYGLTSIGVNFTTLQKSQYFEHLYYSVSILSTIDSANISPITNIAKVFIMIEAFTGIYLLILIVTAFSTITKEIAYESRKKLIERIDREVRDIQNIAKEKLQFDISQEQVVLETKALPIGNQVEKDLIKNDK